MGNHQFTLVFLLMLAKSKPTHSQAYYYIKPSPQNVCPHDLCITLSEFRELDFNCHQGNISLIFLPGNHRLDGELSLLGGDNISMIKHELDDNGTVIVECESQSGRFNISEIAFVTIRGLNFMGCGGNKASQVEEFIIEDTAFQGVENRGTALILNDIPFARIERSSFIFNKHGPYVEQHSLSLDPSKQERIDYLFLKRNSSFSVGGALYAAFSNISILNCKFDLNTAEIGGALFAYNSSIQIIGSTYNLNEASFGGVIVTSESHINVHRTKFSFNAAKIFGGAMITYKDTLIITSTIFDYNNVFTESGVTEIYESSLSISDCFFNANTAGSGGVIGAADGFITINTSTFVDNSALFGGVIITLARSSFNIANSIFTSNSAFSSGGVISTSDNSSLNIISSAFIMNSASSGGVMACSLQSSLFKSTIINSTFANNSASTTGGVLYTIASSFYITHSSFTSNNSSSGGVIAIYSDSLVNLISSNFITNSASTAGGVVVSSDSLLSIVNSVFTNNNASSHYNNGGGGVFFVFTSSFFITDINFAGTYGRAMNSSVDIMGSSFTNNSAFVGGVMVISGLSSLRISSSTFSKNSATILGGVISITDTASFSLFSNVNIFTSNGIKQYSVYKNGGSLISDGGEFAFDYPVPHNIIGSFRITNCTFAHNNANYGGAIQLFVNAESSLIIINSLFIGNSATFSGGVIYTSALRVYIDSCDFISSNALRGGVFYLFTNFNGLSTSVIANSTFVSNSASFQGGVLHTRSIHINSFGNTFANNSATHTGGVIWCLNGLSTIQNTNFSANSADRYGGIMLITACSTDIADSTFDHNLGSVYTFNSNLNFIGLNRFENSAEQPIKTETDSNAINFYQEGGAITSFQSTVTFNSTGVSHLSSNQARNGGAILAIESTVTINGKVTIKNNTATNSSGGGISLHQSDLEIKGYCSIANNHARKGGGIHTTSSTIIINHDGTLEFINNRADTGGGLHLEGNSKLYLLYRVNYGDIRGQIMIFFANNQAKYGGAIYVEDNTNSGACSPDNECFIQALTLDPNPPDKIKESLSSLTQHVYSFNNTATEKGPDIFGGLLDRCIPSPFAEVYIIDTTYYSGTTYLGNISNITPGSISSLPVRICFCIHEDEPDCDHQPPIFKVKKGEAFNVTLVAVDNVNHPVSANIISSLLSPEGGFSEGQQTQRVNRNCTSLFFNVFSPHEFETIRLFADGPCGSSTPSIRHIDIQFLNCTCPVGFEPSNNSTRCECICDSRLSPYITDCISKTSSLIRVNTNSWISYINYSSTPGFVIHPNCPFDYCQLSTKNISINLDVPNGADMQCANNRGGILCGACQENFSLSLGSSQCLPCQRYWPAMLIVILLAAIIAGNLLVVSLLALNLTVTAGLINSFILYANIVAANSALYLPSSIPSFPTIFLAWLNLDIGVDVCFFDGLDAYTKTWLQLAFPAYIICLVIFTIVISEHSPRFTRVIGRKDPVGTLATLILLSYTKLLSVTNHNFVICCS